MDHTIDVEADSLKEAKERVRSLMPEGQEVISEKVVSDGQKKSAESFAETTEKAFAKAQDKIPGDAVVLEKRVLMTPEERTVKAEGFDEKSAREQVARGLGKSAKIQSINLVAAGKKGFLGIGRKPNQYAAEVFQQAVVKIVYKQKAKISAKTGFKNRGDRQEDLSQAVAYWMARMSSPKKDPFVLYIFDTEKDAREALLELPCIHEGEDQKLICTEYLIFGHYRQADGKYEAILCGDELTHELWEQAKISFETHGGKHKNDLEPEKRPSSTRRAANAQAESVVFLREECKPSKLGTATCVYRIHKGPDAASARAFLEKNPVTRNFYYLIVETPEGNFGRDIQGIYRE
jgi:hypothetical protein